MTEIKLDVKDPAGLVRLLREMLPINADDFNPDERPTIEGICAQIERQVKHVIDEPTEFGSIVRASTDEHDDQLWTPAPYIGEHYWMGETRVFEVWPELTDVEVLRVGLGGEYNPSLQQIRDLLFRSPTGYLTNEETLSAYKDLRRGLSALLAVEELAP